MKSMFHAFLMVLGCLVPLLLIFLLPVLGVRGNFSLVLLIALVFGAHLLMMRWMHGDDPDRKGDREGGHDKHRMG